jgi:hypothetical protein
MANGSNYAKYASPTMRNLLGAEYGGKVRAMHDEFTFASAAIGTVVNVGILKKGEVFLGALLVSAALGANVTVQLGDSGDDDRYIAATVCTSAVEAFKCAQAGMGYKATADTPLVLKTGGAEATGKVQLVIFKAASN